MSVVPFKPKAQIEEENSPHIYGTGFCTVCKYEWPCVALIGIYVLTCPRCEIPRGVWMGPIEPPEKSEVFTCKHCDGQVFFIWQSQGMFCICCGFLHAWADVVDTTERHGR